MIAGVEAMGLSIYGDRRHKMANVTGVVIPAGVDGERVRTRMREEFEIEIGTAFGPLAGKIWRIGAMGWNCTKPNVLTTLGALEAVLRGEGVRSCALRRGGGRGPSRPPTRAPHDARVPYPRDMVGYAASPPSAAWPGGARIALQFVLNYEEGAENNVLHGDAAAESFLSEMVNAQPIPDMRHMSMESLYEYGSRAGFWRLHRLFHRAAACR